MGTRDIHAFANDASGNVLHECQQQGFVWTDAFLASVRAEYENGYIDADTGQMLVALAELLAFLAGQSEQDWLGDEVPEDLVFDAPLAKRVRKDLKLVLSRKSELRDLWAEAEEFGEWKKSVKGLRRRLKDALRSEERGALERPQPSPKPGPRELKVGQVMRIDFDDGGHTHVIVVDVLDKQFRIAFPYELRDAPRASIAEHSTHLLFVQKDFGHHLRWPLIQSVDLGDVSILTRHEAEFFPKDSFSSELWIVEAGKKLFPLPSEPWPPNYASLKTMKLSPAHYVESVINGTAKGDIRDRQRSEFLLSQFREQVRAEAEEE